MLKKVLSPLCLGLTLSTTVNAIEFHSLANSKSPAGIDVRYYMTQGFDAQTAENLYYKNRLYHIFFKDMNQIIQANRDYLLKNQDQDGKNHGKLSNKILTKIKIIKEQILIDLYDIILPLNGTYHISQCRFPSTLLVKEANTLEDLTKLVFDADKVITQYAASFQKVAPWQVDRILGHIKTKANYSAPLRSPTNHEQSIEQPIQHNEHLWISIYCADLSTETLKSTMEKVRDFKQRYLD